MHYFRQVPEYWEETIQKMANCGCNMVYIYIAWNIHEPEKGVYNFTGMADLDRFINLCEKYDLYVCLRVGPYICGAVDYGGLPYWLMTSGISQVRTMDPVWLKHVDEWFDILLPMMKKHMYVNGGTTLIVQIENEYGGKAGDCSKPYLKHLADYVRKYLGEETVCLTVDSDQDIYVSRGSNAEVALVTTDFSFNESIKDAFAMAKKYNGGVGPDVNGEYHPGDTDHWRIKHNTVTPVNNANYIDDILALNASIDIYMMYGGTNFGFYAGSHGGETRFNPCTTSYDFDAPLSEAGDMTYKYQLLKKVIKKHYPQYIRNYTVKNHTKAAYGKVHFTKSIRFVDAVPYMSHRSILSEKPKSFEEIKQTYGFVVYAKETDGGILRFKRIRDRAYIFVDGKQIDLVEILQEHDVKIPKGYLEIFAESHGRLTSGVDYFDTKGIHLGVTLDGKELLKWKQIPLEFDHIPQLPFEDKIYSNCAAFYRAEFQVDEPCDTFLNPTGLKHGSVIINGFNIGRYWTVGPQLTLYVPAPILKKGTNEIIILETDGVENLPDIAFEDKPIIDTIK